MNESIYKLLRKLIKGFFRKLKFTEKRKVVYVWVGTYFRNLKVIIMTNILFLIYVYNFLKRLTKDFYSENEIS